MSGVPFLSFRGVEVGVVSEEVDRFSGRRRGRCLLLADGGDVLAVHNAQIGGSQILHLPPGLFCSGSRFMVTEVFSEILL